MLDVGVSFFMYVVLHDSIRSQPLSTAGAGDEEFLKVEKCS
jgi:hypothetical protein